MAVILLASVLGLATILMPMLYYIYDPTTDTGPDYPGQNITRRYIENQLQEAPTFDKGMGCDIPILDPFSKEIMQFDQTPEVIECHGQDWVKCYHSKCRVVDVVKDTLKNITCIYEDILYETDKKFTIGPPKKVDGDGIYELKESDHVKVQCVGRHIGSSVDHPFSLFQVFWTGNTLGFRPVPPLPTPPGREHSFNVVVFGYESTARNGFIRNMPKSWQMLKNIGATIMEGYNVVGDGTRENCVPILTGKTPSELPDVRPSKRNKATADSFPLIFYKLKQDGYRTSFFDDRPVLGLCHRYFNGFLRQPADHYLRAFSEVDLTTTRHMHDCIGDTPQFKVMINITKQSKLEERLPLLAIRLPDRLRRERPHAQRALEANARALTTPHDLHATLLDVLDMKQHWNTYKVPGADLPRALTMLEPIPRTRACSEAGIAPHWCTCAVWQNVSTEDPLFEKTAHTLVNYINSLVATVGFLATGNSFRSLAFSFRMGKTTVADVVYATCLAIWTELVNVHMKKPTQEDLKAIASDYYRLWQFPMCIGSMDGKHCRVKCPAKSGSSYYNYKNYFSIILQAVADANKKFIVIEVGGKGKQSDGGTFHYSTLNTMMENGQLDIPPPDMIPGTTIRIPYVFIADEAYPLKENIMRPFPSRNISPKNEYFNSRLSRARKCIECTFGILCAKWRILNKPIETNVKNACLIIKTTCILHNIIRDFEGRFDDDIHYESRLSTENEFPPNHPTRRNNSSSVESRRVRDQFSDYFWSNKIDF